MPAGLQILALLGMTCFPGWCELPAAQDLNSGARIIQADHRPAPVLTLQDITTDNIADKAVALEDDDFRDDPRSVPSGSVSLEERNSRGVVNTRLQRAISSRSAKHPRIYIFCSLII